MNVRDMIPWAARQNGRRAPDIQSEGRNSLVSLQDEMNRVFDDFWRDFDLLPTRLARSGWPNLDLVEGDNEYKLTVELPGLDEKDVELTFRDNALTISGERRAEQEDRKGGRYYAERYYGRFSRTVPFDVEVDPEKIAAAFRNGVLTIVAPKSGRALSETKRIAIQKLS